MKGLLLVLSHPEAEPELAPWPPDTRTEVAGVREHRRASQEDLKLHTIGEMTESLEIGNHRPTRLLGGALEILQARSHFIEGGTETAGCHRY